MHEPHSDLTEKIIACAVEVHRVLGPGLLESVYQFALVMELIEAGLKVRTGVLVPIIYKGTRLEKELVLDVLVEDVVVVEIKAVDRYHPVRLAQLITYLKLSNRPRGLLFNFHTASLRQAGIRSAVRPDLYEKKGDS